MINVCVPVLRKYDLLRRLLESLAAGDRQPDAVYVLDNGRNAEAVEQATDGFLFPIIVETPEANFGVAASWNWFIKNVAEDRIIANDDIVFGPSSLDKMLACDADLVFGVGFSCFLIRDSCVEKLGPFDETISPNYAYFEDCDYMERAHAEPSVRLSNADAGLVHGDGKDGSATWRAGTPEEIEDHHRRYRIAQKNFYKKWGAEPQVLEARRLAAQDRLPGKRRLLWIGDAGCPSGFARATHEVLDVLRHEYDVTVLGMNYRGDPTRANDGYAKYYEDGAWPYPIYAAGAEGDAFGIARLIWMCDLVKPDLIVLQNDPWNVPLYLNHLKHFKEYTHVPVVAAVAVDGKNCNGAGLNGLTLAIFWTQFALDEARAGGYDGPAAVIPLGVDLAAYHPIDRQEARSRVLPKELDEAFIVGNVNRNQPRKRWDLTIKYFAEWIKSRKVRDAYLFLHTAPTGDAGIDVVQLATYHGIVDRLILVTPPTFYGVSDDRMRDTYNCFDVQVSTTQGEGFGLTTFEGMACGVPQVVPEWSALGELCKGAAWMVPCTSTAVGPPYVNVIGGIADEERFVQALAALYNNRQYRETNRQAGLERVAEERFRWPVVGQAWLAALAGLGASQDRPGLARTDVPESAQPSLLPAVSAATEAEWEDLGRPQEAHAW